ncbi:serine/threonine protein kinase [Amycolatopsis cynarae]|uniref:Serine/threonine protein kinase n=1 Tax=Amycolatopsis cynarae TaxID=2995223 RepID=A0ABY7B862_9PSEU|nr:serine/threonine-protein kinase [Amycolatopsis sp. HUAS 11-8]WAL68530.1 serine/threonine protein kinase [Amycolatopsis sp. HUAS 11-8]
MADDMSLAADHPRMIGPYRVVALLGRGGRGPAGLGPVFLGRGPDGRLVSLKQVRPQFADDAMFRARFRRQVAVAQRVSSRYVAAVVDSGPEDPVPWLASEFVPGVPLDAALAAGVRRQGRMVGGRLDSCAARWLATCLARGLTQIRRAGLAHGDLKPSSVVLTEDGARLIGLAIGRGPDVQDAEGMGRAWPAGSLHYLSPERLEGRPPNEASDVFALARVIFAATTKYPSWDTADSREPRRRKELHRIFEPCLAPDPAVRPTPKRLLQLIGRIDQPGPPWPPWVHEEIARRNARIDRLLDQLPATTEPARPAPPPDEETVVFGEPLPRSPAAVDSLVFSPDSRVLVIASSGKSVVRLWDVAGRRPFGGAAGPQTDEGQPEAKRGKAAAKRRKHGRIAADVLGAARRGDRAAFSPDGRVLALGSVELVPGIDPAGGDDQGEVVIHLWDVAARRLLGGPLVGEPRLIGDLSHVTGLAFSRDGRAVAASWDGDGGVAWWDTVGRRELGRLSDHPGVVTFSPDGGTIATGNIDGVHLRDLRSSVPRRVALGGEITQVHDMAFSTDGRTLAIATESVVHLWDVTDRRRIGAPLTVPTVRRSHGAGVLCVAFSPDGHTLATGDDDGVVNLWNIADGKRIRKPLTGHLDRITRVAFSPDGRSLATGDRSGFTAVWDLHRPR